MGSPYMLSLLLGAWLLFGWSARRRMRLLLAGAKENRFDRIKERLLVAWRYAFAQEKMDYYQPAGIAHKLIFVGFMVLLLRTLVLWGRGFWPSFNLFVLEPWSSLGKAYEFAKDSVAMLVLAGVCVFFYYRVIRPVSRTTKSFEAIVILAIIGTMMLADMSYDGAALVLAARKAELCGNGAASIATASQCDAIRTIVAPLGEGVHSADWSPFPNPSGSLFAVFFHALPPGALVVVATVGFWAHATLPLIFLNLLPYSKHFHVITAVPNVALKDLNPPGRLKPIAGSAEKLGEIMMAASELPDPAAAPIGIARAEHFTWKAILDFYTCTECGRCSENCPAHRTGKLLSPKLLTLDLRDHLYGREDELIAFSERSHPGLDVEREAGAKPTVADAAAPALQAINMSPDLIHPDVLWACTTCRACEEQCPVMISYVDKIVDMRRNLYLVRNEFPHELGKAFQAIEVNGNPWNLSRLDRAAWSDGLGIKTFAEHPTAQVLYWVGCAASYDDRAKKIARATARLLQKAGVDFAILGQEESCTGDPARRAGNELLFLMLAEQNVATLNGYVDQGGVRTVVTACPHCFNTIKNEYPDFGATLDVVHHTDFLLGLLSEKKLVPSQPVTGKVAYHDSCYLGRYNGVYEPPREILRRIPGVELVEVEYWNKQRGLCCGAGGAQMWMEEQKSPSKKKGEKAEVDRVNVKRTLQLLDTGADTVASGCPFCMTMLTDGIKSQSLEERVKQLDVAELLERSCIEQVLPEVVPAAAE